MMMKNFLKDHADKLSSKRLLGLILGFVGVLVVVFGSLAHYWLETEYPFVPIIGGSVLVGFAVVLAGIATVENITNMIKAIRGR